MKWVKASERLPTTKDWVFCKHSNGRRDMHKLIHGIPWPEWAEFWLDESTPKVSAWEIYKSHCETNQIYPFSNEDHTIIDAMHEYASLVSASKDKEIARLKEDMKELVEAAKNVLDESPIVGEIEREPTPLTYMEYLKAKTRLKQLIPEYNNKP